MVGKSRARLNSERLRATGVKLDSMCRPVESLSEDGGSSLASTDLSRSLRLLIELPFTGRVDPGPQFVG